MVTLYRNPTIVHNNMKFRYVNEKGTDISGVTRDVYSAFWENFLLGCCEGARERVTGIRPEFGLSEWESATWS